MTLVENCQTDWLSFGILRCQTGLYKSSWYSLSISLGVTLAFRFLLSRIYRIEKYSSSDTVRPGASVKTERRLATQPGPFILYPVPLRYHSRDYPALWSPEKGSRGLKRDVPTY